MGAPSLILISPSIGPTHKSEAELFGAMTWLWMHSPTHRRCPLYELERLLLPALKTGQFMLALENNEKQQPAGLMTWANFSAQAEQQYLQSLDRTLQPSDWQSGDRPWILDWVVPFGRTHAMRAAQKLLPSACFRGLYHKGDQTGLKVLYVRGAHITPEQEVQFWASRPLPDGFKDPIAQQPNKSAGHPL